VSASDIFLVEDDHIRPSATQMQLRHKKTINDAVKLL